MEYRRFCDEIESIFTIKHLEKMPQEEVLPFKPPVEWELNSLTPEETEKFMQCMTKIKEKVTLISLSQMQFLFSTLYTQFK